MPAGLAISYPLGRSLDENFNIQIDSDANKTGGIIPDIRVPFTREKMNAKFVDSEDVELNDAIAYLDNLTSGIDDPPSQPKTVQLYTNYPNPFNPITLITYYLPKSMHVELVIYNVRGQEITTLVNDQREAGYNTTIWNGVDNQGRNVGSGVYLYKLTVDNYIDVRKMVLVR